MGAFPELIARVGEEAPGVRPCFVQKADKDSKPLRDGRVELETGVVGQTAAPELRVQALFRNRFIGVVRLGRPLSEGQVTPSRYAAGRHVYVSRQGANKGPIDEALSAVGLKRKIVIIVSGFSTALALARASDLIASVPELHTGNLRAGMHSFPIPSPRQRSPFHCFGTPDRMQIPRIDGYVVTSEMSVRCCAEMIGQKSTHLKSNRLHSATSPCSSARSPPCKA